MKIKITSLLIILFVFACGGTKNFSSNEELVLAKKKYILFCAACHGRDGKMAINGATDLTKSISGLKSRIKTITEGKGLMTSFKGVLSTEEIEAVAKYSIHLRKESKK
ncbi:MAG: cytochrome c [Saprospiraceae bacterium]